MNLRRRTPLRARAGLPRRSPLRTRSQKRKGARYTGPDRTTRELVLERDSGCVLCGNGPYDLQVHHRKPRRMGGRKVEGANAPSNLITLCPQDHFWVESSRTEALEMGLLLTENDDPREVPTVHHQFGSVFLLDDGTVRPVPSWEES